MTHQTPIGQTTYGSTTHHSPQLRSWSELRGSPSRSRLAEPQSSDHDRSLTARLTDSWEGQSPRGPVSPLQVSLVPSWLSLPSDEGPANSACHISCGAALDFSLGLPMRTSFQPEHYNTWTRLITRATLTKPAERDTRNERVVVPRTKWGAEVPQLLCCVLLTARQVTWNHTYRASSSLDTEMLMTRLDMTPRRMRRLFERCDRENQRSLTLQQLSDGLKYQDIEMDDDTMQLLSAELNGPTKAASDRFTLEQFVTVLQLLSLAELLVRHDFNEHHLDSSEVAQRLALRCVDYGGNFYRPWMNRPSALVCGASEMFEFFFGDDKEDDASPSSCLPPREGRLRCVLLTGARNQLQDGVDRVMLARLAVKYRIHPLALKDMLSFGSSQTRAKKCRSRVDRNGSDLLICLPLIQLRRSRDGGDCMDGSKSVDLCVNSYCMHVDTSENTVIGIQMNDEPPRGAVYGGSGREIGATVRKALSYPDTALREAGLAFLVFRVLETAIDEIPDVVGAIRQRLHFMQTQLKHAKRNPTKFEPLLEEVAEMREHLAEMARLLRPVKFTIAGVAEELTKIAERESTGVAQIENEQSERRYSLGINGTMMEGANEGPNFNLLQDHMEQITEELEALTESVAALRDDYNNLVERRTNDILYVLTMVTTVIVPMQTLSGIYGMNFVHQDGSPAMPELTSEWGYAGFWISSFGLSSLIFVAFKTMGWL